MTRRSGVASLGALLAVASCLVPEYEADVTPEPGSDTEPEVNPSRPPTELAEGVQGGTGSEPDGDTEPAVDPSGPPTELAEGAQGGAGDTRPEAARPSVEPKGGDVADAKSGRGGKLDSPIVPNSGGAGGENGHTVVGGDDDSWGAGSVGTPLGGQGGGGDSPGEPGAGTGTGDQGAGGHPVPPGDGAGAHENGAGTAGTSGRGGTAGEEAGGLAGQPTVPPAESGSAGVSGAPGCTPRECASPEDNDCDGYPDREAPECECTDPTASQSCLVPGAEGACETGVTSCRFAPDGSSSSWTDCVGPAPGTRNCLSLDDHDCDGVSDALQCGCPTPNATEPCAVPGALGVCQSGTRTCHFAADDSSSEWSNCVGPSPGTRDCRYDTDSDCNGVSDSAECECSPIGATRECGSAEQLNRVGACSPGTATCVESTDHSTTSWSECVGGQGPTSPEACGPTAVDANCDGINGDGSGNSCLTTLYVFAKRESTTTCGSCGTNCETTTVTTGYRAAEYAPAGSWTLVSQFKAFISGGTVPVCNCGYGDIEYVQLGSCTPASGSGGGSPEQVEVVGYVADTGPNGYVPLTSEGRTLSRSAYGSPSVTVTFSLPGSGTSASGSYVLP